LFCGKRSISLPTYTSFSASQQIPQPRKAKRKKGKNVFPKQTPRNGFDETVSFFKLMFLNLFLRFWVLFILFCFVFVLLVLLVLTRMMSDYKVEMINDGMQEFYVDFHGPKDSKSSLPTSIFFIFFSFDFQSDICVSLHKVELFFFFHEFG
jgi:hypothetical protein